MLEYIGIIIVFFILSYFLNISRSKEFTQEEIYKNNNTKEEHYDNLQKKYNEIKKEFTQEEIDKNNNLKKEHYDNLQKKYNKIKIKYDKVATKNQDSFSEFRKMLD